MHEDLELEAPAVPRGLLHVEHADQAPDRLVESPSLKLIGSGRAATPHVVSFRHRETTTSWSRSVESNAPEMERPAVHVLASHAIPEALCGYTSVL